MSSSSGQRNWVLMIGWLSKQANFSEVLAVVLMGAILGGVAYSIYFERKISAWIQDRLGPNRVGTPPFLGNLKLRGLGQPIADGLKFLLKEDIIPDKVDKPLYIIAPCISLIVAMVGFVVIPWGGKVSIGGEVLNVQVANPDIGLLYLLAVGSMGIYGVVLGGWASNNKYSIFGGVRATAQMLSYEIPMGLAILVVVLTCGQVRLDEIVLSQIGAGQVWNVFRHQVAFVIMWITLFAETNRTPFDLAEAEQELVGGFHTEYSAMKFAMFFLAEYAHMITGCAFLAVLFLGGWHLPWISWCRPESTGLFAMVVKMLVMGVKIAFFMFVFMLVRWTLPRFRFDQLMRLAWKGLIPIGLGILLVVIVGLYFGLQDRLWFTLTGNAVVVAVALWWMSSSDRKVTGRQANLPPILGEGAVETLGVGG